jgi:hypothetical protein
MEPEFFTPANYHSLVSMENLWTKEPNFQALRVQFLEKYTFIYLLNNFLTCCYQKRLPTVNSEQDETLKAKVQEKCWRKALINYALQHMEEYKDVDELLLPKENILRAEARNYLVQRLEFDLSNIQELLEKLVGCIQEDLQQSSFTTITPQKQPRKDKLPPPATSRSYDDKGQRKRFRWSEEEDMILIKNHKSFAQVPQVWSKICGKLSNRTNVDCKDRWRTLIKKHKSQQVVYELLSSSEPPEPPS